MSLEGIDLVLEGEATRVTDRPTLERLAGLYREGGWPAEVEGEAFTAPYSAPSAGTAALVPLPLHLPHGLRRRHRGAVRRDPLAVLGLKALTPLPATPPPPVGDRRGGSRREGAF